MMPIPGSVEAIAEKLLTPVETTEEPVETPPVEPSEVVEETTEASEEVVEEEVTEVTEPSETETFITELNDYLKDPADFDKIRIPTKVNGVESQVPLSDIVANHQISQASEERLNALKTEKAEFEQQKSQLQTQYSEQLKQAADLVTALEKRLTTEAEQVNWQELRDTDPAEYSAKRQDLLERQQELQSTRSHLSQEYQSKVNENYATVIKAQSQALPERIPEWSTPEIKEKESSEVRDYLLNQGFTRLEVDGNIDANGNILSMGVVDARAIAMARKAMLYDRGDKTIDLVKKKVKKLPKVAKPGKPITSQEVDSEKAKKLRGRLKESGKVEDAAVLIKQRLFGG